MNVELTCATDVTVVDHAMLPQDGHVRMRTIQIPVDRLAPPLQLSNL